MYMDMQVVYGEQQDKLPEVSCKVSGNEAFVKSNKIKN